MYFHIFMYPALGSVSHPQGGPNFQRMEQFSEYNC